MAPQNSLAFGTSGLRGLVVDMTDREVYANTAGFLRFLESLGEVGPGSAVAVAEDLRERDPESGLSSSPRIGRAVVRAIEDAGLTPVLCGQIPTPALAYYARAVCQPACQAIMVTGSHIPANRNGVKFYRARGEVLKDDEAAILASIAAVRAKLETAADGLFSHDGMFQRCRPLPAPDPNASRAYVQRTLDLFPGQHPLGGMRVVVFEHSAVGRDLLVEILRGLGAEVIEQGRSDAFVAVDTEDVSPEDERRYRGLIQAFGASALVSTDGDGDRPLVVDERGRFQRGDILGLVCAERLGARFAAVPVSASDAIERHLDGRGVAIERTRIGSPYVIAAMQAALERGLEGVVGWEANGGFLTASDFSLGAGCLKALPTRDAVLPIVAALLEGAEAGSLAQVFDRLPQRATRAGLLDAFPPDRGRALVDALRPRSADAQGILFGPNLLLLEKGGTRREVAQGSPEALRLEAIRRLIEAHFGAQEGFGAVSGIDLQDGGRISFEGGDIVHLRPSGNAPQFRIYVVADRPARADQIVARAVAEPDGALRRLERAIFESHDHRVQNLLTLRKTVDRSEGPHQVIAIANGDDGPLVQAELEAARCALFRADGATTVFAHEERERRGQFLGLLDAQAAFRAAHGPLDPERVAVGIMLPGKGTRLSPLTQRLYGIKPFLPTLVRHQPASPWLTAAQASLYTWTLVARELERAGFRGIAWKWGDEPQIASRPLSPLAQDLRDVDAVRFGAMTEVTADLALNKEWLLVDPESHALKLQVRRRSREELLRAFGLPAEATGVRAAVHIGSPAFSHLFLEAAERCFADLRGPIDVDGFLFEALTRDRAAWEAERERDRGLQRFLGDVPDFYERVQELVRAIAAVRGRPPVFRVVDFGEDLYWGDVGQLDKARQAFLAVCAPGLAGQFARLLAAIDGVPPDAQGNRFVNSKTPEGARLRNSVVIDSALDSDVEVAGAVIVGSALGRARLATGAVVIGSTALDLEAGADSLVFRSIGERLRVPARMAHTSIPADPLALSAGLEDFWADLGVDLGADENYLVPRFSNPTSFGAKFQQMRQRDRSPSEVEAEIDRLFRAPLLAKLRPA